MDEFNLPNPTKYEELLKWKLEQRGVSVVQQMELSHPWGKIHFDLAIPDWKLIVEVDGSHHVTDPERIAKDKWRRRTAREAGWRMLRFTNKQLFDQPVKVMEMIMRYKPGGPRGLNTLRKI